MNFKKEADTEEQLRLNLDTFFHLIENAPFGVYVINSQFRLCQVNACAQKVFNNVRPLMGRDLAEILRIIWPEPFASDAISRFRHTLANGEPYAAPNTTEKRHDISETESYDWKIERITFPDGQFGVVCYFYDITERLQSEKALRESEEAFRSSEERFRNMAEERQKFVFLADHSTDFIGMCDMEFQPFYVNKAGLDLVGLDHLEQACRTPVPEFFFPEDQSFIISEFFPKVLREGKGEVEIRFRNFKTGQAIWMIYNVLFVKSSDGVPVGLATISRNITERKQSEESIKRYAEELKRSNKDLEQFASIASHDLQEPLRVISSYAQLLQKKYKDKLETSGNEYAEYIIENVSKMTQLTHDLLAYSQVGRENKFKDVDMSDICRKAIQNLAVMIKDNEAKIVCDPLPRMTVDEALMTQLFQNMINNAIKFRSPQNPPEIHISTQSEGDRWVLQFKDNGIGIAPEHYDRIFDIFRRLHTQSEFPGTGIGLALCKRIVEFHQGRIWVESEYGKGTTFYIALPKDK